MELKIKANQEALELHKPMRRNFTRRKVIVTGIDDLWVLDLVDMGLTKVDQGYHFILVVMDVLSRYAFCRPVKTKDTTLVAQALDDIMKTSGRKPKMLWSDQGGEFSFHVSSRGASKGAMAVSAAQAREKNKYLDPFKAQFENIYTTTTKNRKVWLIERLNRTLKNIMWFKMTRAQLRKKQTGWVDRLPKIVAKYNNTFHRGLTVPGKYFHGDFEKFEEYHSTITPTIASQPDMEDYDLEILQDQVNMLANKKPKLKVGDLVRVRLPETQDMLYKGFEIHWSPKIYRVVMVNMTKPVTYRIELVHPTKTVKGEEKPEDIGWYEEEVQKTKSTEDTAIEVKKPKKRTRAKKKSLL